MEKYVFKKCNKCGALVRVIEDCNCEGCGIKCCNENMTVLRPSTIDALAEKHKPTYEVDGDMIHVKVNHIMEKDHYIKFIAMEVDGNFSEVQLEPNDIPECDCQYVPGAKLYAYCNKHDLWMTEVK